MATKAEQIRAMAPGTKFISSNDRITHPDQAGKDFWIERTESGYKFAGERAVEQGVEDEEFPEFFIPLIFTEKLPYTGDSWEIEVI